MNVRKRKIQYYFSVEGETEKWYLEWLQRQINSTDNAAYGVVFNVKVEKDPVNRVKGMAILTKTDIWHFSDYESSEPEHVKQFQSTMARMEQSQHLKQVKYHFGYSNLTFDLWMILHKKNCNAAKVTAGNILPISIGHLMKNLRICINSSMKIISNAA